MTKPAKRAPLRMKAWAIRIEEPSYVGFKLRCEFEPDIFTTRQVARDAACKYRWKVVPVEIVEIERRRK